MIEPLKKIRFQLTEMIGYTNELSNILHHLDNEENLQGVEFKNPIPLEDYIEIVQFFDKLIEHHKDSYTNFLALKMMSDRMIKKAEL